VIGDEAWRGRSKQRSAEYELPRSVVDRRSCIVPRMSLDSRCTSSSVLVHSLSFKIAEQIATHGRSEIALRKCQFSCLSTILFLLVFFRACRDVPGAQCNMFHRDTSRYLVIPVAVRNQNRIFVEHIDELVLFRNTSLMWNFTTCTRCRIIVISASYHIA
jgi:hypothetical protein